IRRSLRAWSVLFGLILQLLSIAMLMITVVFTLKYYPTLALTIWALSYLATMLILRDSNSPIDAASNQLNANHTLTAYTNALGIGQLTTKQWLTSINSQSMAFNLMWRSPNLGRFLSFTAMVWLLYVLVIDFDHWLASRRLATTALLGL